ncbi:MAG TPA: hypothetical protein VMX58_10325 [Patescibacteria group bacterium]|nr:hypothetical protein [Patescibacteria group bacterium]
MNAPLKAILIFLLVASNGWIRAHGAGEDPCGLRFPRGRADNIYQQRALRRLPDPAHETVDGITLLVVRVAFTDRDFLAPHDSLYYTNELRHLNEYFDGASRHRFTIDADIHPVIVTLSRPESYYGEDGVWDERVVEMLMEIVEATDSEIDYAGYDAFAVVHPGAGQETDFNGDSPQQLWSGFVDPVEMAGILADTLGTPGVPTNDTVEGDTVYIDNLMVWPEDASQDGMTFGSLGIYAYQVGLRIGMVPLFDTTPSGYPDSQGIGAFGLMGYGLYNAAGFIPAFPCAYHRYLMGWIDAVEVAHDAEIRITDINTGSEGDTTLIRAPISATEYYLVANRVHDGDFDGAFDFIDVGGDDPIPENEDTLRGAEFDFFLTSSTNPVEYVEGPGGGTVKRIITGSGLMIWHIDESVIVQQLESGGRPEDDPARKGVDLEEADGIQDLDRPGGSYAFGSHYDSFRDGNNTLFGTDTAPSSTNNAGVRSGIIIDDVSAPAHVMTFTIRFGYPLDRVRTDAAGSIAGLSPIPVDLDGLNGEELVVPVQEGLLYVVAGAGDESWTGRIDTLLDVPWERWTGSPVFADLTGDGTPEIFITSKSCSLYACTASGAPFPIDDDASPGAVTVSDTLCSAPIVCEADGDPYPEVIMLAQNDDAVWMYIVGCSIDLTGTDWRVVSSGVKAQRLVKGTLISHPARGYIDVTAGPWEGLYFASISPIGDLRTYFLILLDNGAPLPEGVCISAGGRAGVSAPDHLVNPASGDIDRDGIDEIVLAFPGLGVIYTNPGEVNVTARLEGARPSSPVLADIDRDGVLETVIRDEAALYVYTGFGVLLDDWPVALPGAVTAAEPAGPPPPAIVGDLDGDGRGEVLFSAGGDLHAYEASGIPVEGWPLPGAGAGSGSPAFLKGQGEMLYLFVASSAERVEGTGITGPASGASRTSLLRYDIGVPYSGDQSWPFHRRDERGSGWQEPSPYTAEPASFVDEHSFICYPNPVAGGDVTVRVVIHTCATVRIRIMNLEGEVVADHGGYQDDYSGGGVPFEKKISTGSLSSGVYICHIEVQHLGRVLWSGARTFAVVR